MLDNKNTFQLTQLAEASYADLWDNNTKKPISNYDKTISKLTDRKISKTQATDLLSNWSIAGHQRNTSSGFSATLFQSKDGTNKYVLAFRGTEPTSLFKDWSTDLGDIVRDGLALDQIVDMYNYWQQLNAPKGASYDVAVLETLTQETINYNLAKLGEFVPAAGMAADLYIAYLRSRSDIIIDEPLGLVRTINLNHRSTEIYSDERRTGLGINPADVTVVGHSLGGHLAAAFSRLFPDATSDVLMVNGAGFGDQFAVGAGGNGSTNVAHLFSMLEGATSFNPNKITNLIGSAGIDLTAQDTWIGLHQPGGSVHIQTESWGLFSTALGHGASQMTDSMAVYDLFMQLDSNLGNGSTEAAIKYLEPIFKAGSAWDKETLESLVNALGKMLVAGYQELGPAQRNNREELYSRIKQIQAILPAPGATVGERKGVSPRHETIAQRLSKEEMLNWMIEGFQNNVLCRGLTPLFSSLCFFHSYIFPERRLAA